MRMLNGVDGRDIIMKDFKKTFLFDILGNIDLIYISIYGAPQDALWVRPQIKLKFKRYYNFCCWVKESYINLPKN